MDLSAIKIKVTADTKEANSNLKQLEKTGESLGKIGKGLTIGLTTPILAFGAASVKAADSLRQTQRKTQVIFGNMTKDVQAWALENERTFGLGAGTIEGYTGKIADLTQGMGLGKKESLDMAKGAMELGVQLSNWNGVGADVAMEDLTRAISGSHEAVEKYGIKLNETVLNEQARKMGLGETFNKLKEAEKAQVRYNAIIGASGNAIEFWNKGNRSTAFYMGEIKEQVGNVMETLGGVFLPVLDKVVKKVADWTAGLAKFLSENPGVVNGIIATGAALAALGPGLLLVSKFIALTVKFPALIPIFTGTAAAIGVLGVSFLGANENAQKFLNELPAKIFNGLNSSLQAIVVKIPEFLVKGMEIVNGILDGIILGIPVLTQFISNMVMGLLNTIFTYMPHFLQAGFHFVLNVATGIVQKLPSMVNALVNGVVDLLYKLQAKMPEFLQKGFDFIKNILDGAMQKLPVLLQSMINGIVKILANIRAKMPEFLQRGIEFIANMIKGIANNMPAIISKMGELVSKLISTLIKNLPRFLAEGAKMIVEIVKGLWNNKGKLLNAGKDLIKGLLNSIGAAIKSFVNIGKNIVNSIKEGVSSAWGSFTSWVSNKVSNIPIIGKFFRSMPTSEGGEDNPEQPVPTGFELGGIMPRSPFAALNEGFNNFQNINDNFKLASKELNDAKLVESKSIEIKLNIENFNNNRDIDLEGIMDEIAFNIKRKLAF